LQQAFPNSSASFSCLLVRHANCPFRHFSFLPRTPLQSSVRRHLRGQHGPKSLECVSCRFVKNPHGRSLQRGFPWHSRTRRTQVLQSSSFPNRQVPEFYSVPLQFYGHSRFCLITPYRSARFFPRTWFPPPPPPPNSHSCLFNQLHPCPHNQLSLPFFFWRLFLPASIFPPSCKRLAQSFMSVSFFHFEDFSSSALSPYKPTPLFGPNLPAARFSPRPHPLILLPLPPLTVFLLCSPFLFFSHLVPSQSSIPSPFSPYLETFNLVSHSLPFFPLPLPLFFDGPLILRILPPRSPHSQ